MPRTPIPKWKKARYNRRAYLKRQGRPTDQAQSERSRALSVQLPESLIGRLRRMTNEGIAAGKWPWKTMSECVKTLLIEGLRTKRGDDTIDEMLPHLEYMLQIDKIHQLRREAQGGLSRAKEEINELLSIDAYDGAVRYYHVTMEAAHKMPPTEWRDWMIKELRKAFPELEKTAARPAALVSEPKEPKPKVRVLRGRKGA